LVYCGATRNYNYESDESERDEEGERQIVSVSKMLGLELDMKVTHFTSSESASEREEIKRRFADADPYQAIVAIKCLDEGVNIPSIKTAFILASSTNPKEYIQRRGRVLRKAPNKKYAIIYDFITLPTPLECVNYESETSHYDLSLVRKEINRMKEFGEISINPSDADRLITELVETYGLDLYVNDEEEFYYE
jgi:superfamily II DNA or RNA helicase